jgi:hypothetical protein
VVATVTSDLAHPGEGDDAAPHPIEHHKTPTFPCISRLGSYREAPHERNYRPGETQHPFVESDPTMAPVMAIETPTARIAQGLLGQETESLSVLSSRSYLDLESRQSFYGLAKEDILLG